MLFWACSLLSLNVAMMTDWIALEDEAEAIDLEGKICEAGKNTGEQRIVDLERFYKANAAS